MNRGDWVFVSPDIGDVRVGYVLNDRLDAGVSVRAVSLYGFKDEIITVPHKFLTPTDHPTALAFLEIKNGGNTNE